MLTEKRVGALVYMLENKNVPQSVLSVSKSSKLSYPACINFVRELINLGYAKKAVGGFLITDIKSVIKYISLAYSFKFKEKVYFYDSGSNIKDKLSLIDNSNVSYAFTSFTAGELLYPYVHTEKIYLYVKKSELDTWKEMFIKKHIRYSNEEEGNIFLLPVEQDFYFDLSKKVNNLKIAPLPIVLSDLFSMGAFSEEQANKILSEYITGGLKLYG